MYYYLFTTDNSIISGCEEYQVFSSPKKLSLLEVSPSCFTMAQDIQEGYAWLALQGYDEDSYETEEDYETALAEAEEDFYDSVEWDWEEISEEELEQYVDDLDEVVEWE